ncbi:hypothetical protein [Coxiella burnetii]|uniref:Transcriptional regulator n=2 Tax=Coxiella burnetii TaxID=777 RepID=Q83CT4_COXBU|nr:hypothetical protein [Coxiella burnetii]NP_820025.2 hypothetical protein CBU_1019 [Coxiella burnetii RSA 493]AAO90539.2 hypothetical protein CBU_1019 [Coxiella burnetii RSA 493]ABS76949.1 hypothetical protein CBUD_1024 [Coxiella burnetii Dugway 5J108-111]ACJ20064.1 hypothetical protein CbuK_0821 [Coxiella burnetii CbuK_Q154]ARI65841.1 hypothetical protein B7L74_05245 [Coxiella burnetii]ARK27311.1 hypothetical protein BMW92_05080 [Coxiella burnetii]
MRKRSFEKLAHHLKPGHAYRRGSLVSHSTTIDRDLLRLVQKGLLEKVDAGLYYRPRASRYGGLPLEVGNSKD